MNPTAARGLCIRLAPVEHAEAQKVARAINDPWFRCQALSWVGRYWPDEKYGRILEEAISSADLQDNAYKRTAVSAWPIRAYLERGNVPPAQKHLVKYVAASAEIENLGGRSEAIFLLFQSSKPFAPDLWQPVFSALVSAAEPALSWRQLRSLRNASAMVAQDHPELVLQALQRLTNERNISAIARYLQGPDAARAEPRPFFHQRTF